MREVYVPCPYCGQGVMVQVESDQHQKTVVTCEGEDELHGCGRDFVVNIAVNITTKVRKIEGEEARA